MKRYPQYKDSGVAWLGEVPQHWELKQCRHVFKIHNGATPKSGEADYWGGDIVWITPEDLGNNEGKEISDSRRKISEEGYANCGTSIAPVGSIALSNRAPIGHLAKTAIAACVNQGCRLLEVVDGDADFLYYQLYAAKSELISLGQGTTFMELPRQNLAAVKLALPPLSEQKAIAAWLDEKTAQIDALIRRKQTLLDKLAEKRSALISHAVTKGLNPAAAMKDSGVTWLGDVPQHWEVWKITHGFNRIGSGTTPKSDNSEYYDDGEIPWITTSELREAVIYDTKDKVTTKAVIDYSALKLYPRDSLAFAMYGATIGRLGILGIEAAVNQACCVFAESTIFDTKFVFYWLLMRKPILISLSNGGGQPNLSQDDLKKIRIPIPPLQEQQSIAAFLDTETARIDAQRQAIEAALAKLQEYRSALISHAVTGKIDIRELSAAKEIP